MYGVVMSAWYDWQAPVELSVANAGGSVAALGRNWARPGTWGAALAHGTTERDVSSAEPCAGVMMSAWHDWQAPVQLSVANAGGSVPALGRNRARRGTWGAALAHGTTERDVSSAERCAGVMMSAW